MENENVNVPTEAEVVETSPEETSNDAENAVPKEEESVIEGDTPVEGAVDAQDEAEPKVEESAEEATEETPNE